MSYDLIGDIHGFKQPLVGLLQKLGYEKSDGIYRHPSRRVIFLGDFIDRGPDSAHSHIPEDTIDVEYLLEYRSEEPPVFVGHYWMDSDPNPLAPNVACLDYSVAARTGGKLVAYRWDGEQRVSADKFVHVERSPC